uniref:Uncharacterized protein n=1 Tax=Heterorhabditis bacteriophora TaxID=37862 RepID=A0A1I7WDJ3_HETBA
MGSALRSGAPWPCLVCLQMERIMETLVEVRIGSDVQIDR